MYTPHLIAVPAILANDPVRMPINIQLALPDYVTANADQHIFNLPAAINDLMGSSGWRAASGVMRPRVWARGWNDKQLRKFVTKPFGSKGRPFPTSAFRMLRAREFPGLRSLANRDTWKYPKYEIIHFVGSAEGRGDLSLHVGSNDWLKFGALRDALSASGTRLFILQLRAEQEYGDDYRKRLLEQAVEWATYLVGSGGPTVLVVWGTEAGALDDYFLSLYAGIVHNQNLSLVAQPSSDTLTAELFFGEGGDELLRFDRFRDELYSQIGRLQERKEPLSFSAVGHRVLVDQANVWDHLYMHDLHGGEFQSGKDIVESLRPFLHMAHSESLKAEVARLTVSFERGAAKATENISELQRELDWSHETGGALPVSLTARRLPKFQRRLANLSREFYRNLIEKAWEHVERAPRVLNANFAEAGSLGQPESSSLAPNRGLVAGKEYDLWVDVGPQWNRFPSIVQGSKDFPAYALPVTDQGGWPIQVVFVSEDFSPRISSRQIWVPSKTGRSSPLIQGENASESGPVSVRVVAPLFPKGDKQKFFEAHGRLCLYFGNNLLQSALVRAVIVRSTEVVLEGMTNQIDVDFNMAGSFQEVERFATRTLALDEQGETNWLTGHQSKEGKSLESVVAEHRQLPVVLNLTLNDDGSGKHRILVKSDASLQPVWKPYNVQGTTKLLKRARQELTDCFYRRDTKDCSAAVGSNEPTISLNAENGQDYGQFTCDLLKLAVFGERLFNVVHQEVVLDGTGMTKSDWETSLRQALASRAVIQVARTGEAEYTFPWALVYEYPLPDKDNLRWCKVVQEWNAVGIRNLRAEDKCPFAGNPDHDKNILCPYGFWGLKHHIEQPIPALVNDALSPAAAPQTIGIGPTLKISVGVTRDPGLSLTSIDDHLTRLAKISTLTPRGGADDWSKVQTMLKSAEESPDIVYFLCHGDYDDKADQPFLGVGLPNGQFRYRVYPNELVSWSRGLSNPVWQNPQPLVFINGCHTFALLPDQILNFVSTFAGFGASSVIGTEVSILLPLATEIAELLFDAFVKEGMSLGEAMYQVRWKLANKGNLLGLAYTPYGQSDLRVVRN